MNIENIELSDYERELLEKAIEISNKNFKFIINFLRKKQDTLKKEELWKISQILKEYSFSISPVIMSFKIFYKINILNFFDIFC